jgi:hypothetical protein
MSGRQMQARVSRSLGDATKMVARKNGGKARGQAAALDR